MRSAALEYARYGITINAVMPGVSHRGLQAQGEAYLNQMKNSIPTHTLGEPEDIGYAAFTFFASNEAKYITGQLLLSMVDRFYLNLRGVVVKTSLTKEII